MINIGKIINTSLELAEIERYIYDSQAQSQGFSRLQQPVLIAQTPGGSPFISAVPSPQGTPRSLDHKPLVVPLPPVTSPTVSLARCPAMHFKWWMLSFIPVIFYLGMLVQANL